MSDHIEWPAGEEPWVDTPAEIEAHDHAAARKRVIAVISLIAIILVAAPILIWILF